MKILNNKKYKFHCYECSSDILFSKEDCLVDRIYGDFWLICPVCGREYDNQTYKIFRYEYIEEYDDKDKEIQRLNNIINEAIEYINENWGYWCSNHFEYATETINILKGVDKE